MLFERQETVLVVALALPVQLISHNVRLGVRVELDGHSLLFFSVSNLKLVPLNISIEGVEFFVAKDSLKQGGILQVSPSTCPGNAPWSRCG